MKEIHEEKRKMAEQYVLLRAIAKVCGMDPQTMFTRAQKRGIAIRKCRVGSGQEAYAVSVADAKAIIEAEKRDYEIVRPEDLLK